MKNGAFFIVSLAIIAMLMAPTAMAAGHEIKIGFNIPLTGENPDVGGSSKNAAEMYLKSNPTIQVGGSESYEARCRRCHEVPSTDDDQIRLIDERPVLPAR